MTKQIRTLMGVALLLAAVSALAQTTNTNILEVKVPIPFVTAGKNWPAADYRVQIHTENNTLTLSSRGIGSAIMLTTTGERPREGRTYLQFQRSGDRWFLQEVTRDGTAHVLPPGKSEKELLKERLLVEARPSIEP
jgi:hypothetical protein